jgi:hypothetical protein
MDTAELRDALRAAVSGDRPHVERMSLAAAIVSTALERAGMRATMVGGSAIEFYLPDSYATADVDFVVERATREKLAEVFGALGLTRKDRHWYIGDLYFEVPSLHLTDPFEIFDFEPYTLRVVRKEIVLAERIVGFRYWKSWAYGTQAVEMIRGFGEELDERVLREWLRKEQGEGTYELLREVAASDDAVDAKSMELLWHAHYA